MRTKRGVARVPAADQNHNPARHKTPREGHATMRPRGGKSNRSLRMRCWLFTDRQLGAFSGGVIARMGAGQLRPGQLSVYSSTTAQLYEAEEMNA